MLAYAAGGHWRQHQIKAANLSETETCLLCGGDREDDGHIWRCAGLKHVRDKHPLVSKCHACLPTSLRNYGIAPHVSTDPDHSFWGGEMKGLTKFEAAWIGKGVGAPHSKEAIRGLIKQGRTLHELMLHHAAYDAFNASDPLPPAEQRCAQKSTRQCPRAGLGFHRWLSTATKTGVDGQRRIRGILARRAICGPRTHPCYLRGLR